MNYYDWLVFHVAPDYHLREQYSKLLFALYSTDFYWIIPRDKNRALDGLDLRDHFEEETGMSCDKSGPCSCFEMIFALAIRCENELMYMYDPDAGDQTERWFWMIIENLALDYYDDPYFDEDEVREILDRFMNRDYGSNLEFCAFPVSNDIPNYEKIELAYQLNYFIKEKFYQKFL